MFADVMDEFIFGLDIMKKFSCIAVNFSKRILKVGIEEIILSMPSKENPKLKLIVDEDVRIPGNSEKIVTAYLENKFEGVNIFMFEPDNEKNDGTVIAKYLIKADKVLPVRVVNLKVNRTTLKKGEVLGTCELAAQVTRYEEENSTRATVGIVSSRILEEFK